MLRFGIEAVTIEGHSKVGRGGHTFYHMGRYGGEMTYEFVNLA